MSIDRYLVAQFFYKIIAKILENRLGNVIGHIIGQAQGAFVPGRSIVENIHLAQEMLKHYTRKCVSPRCAMKIDLQKAYDTVHWEFLRDALRLLRFPPRFISWIKSVSALHRSPYPFMGSLMGSSKGREG